MPDDLNSTEGDTADFSPNDPEPTSGAMFGDRGGVSDSSDRSALGGDPPTRIGPYRIVGLIGRGGMGSVYRAIREDDGGQRVVAIKVVKRGVDTEEVLKRFDLERQVLGALDHPNIARFYEAGETEDGRPYFVMEHIEGQRLDEYCDANALPIARRLELFRKVCDALHHAHTNLIVHRDLKPDNILVTPTGEPKLLDFGIAKLLNPALARAQVVTGPAVRMMTPEYASPEQVQGAPVRTVSDVYSLGVLLYELLSGHRPYRFASRMEQEVIRIICETDPDRPSTALGHTEQMQLPDGGTRMITPDFVAKRRAGRHETVRRQIAGDLDDIVLKAMAKAPDRRYPSAEAMSEDIQRHLTGQPVNARRAGGRAGYVLRKFVKRHKAPVAASLLIATVLITGGLVVGSQWRQRQIAEADAQISTLVAGILWNSFTEANVELSLSLDQRQGVWEKIRGDLDKLSVEYGGDNITFKMSLAQALKEQADVLGDTRGQATGDSEGAMVLYRASRQLLQEVLEQRPAHYAAVHLQALDDIKIGDLHRASSKHAEAIASYESADRLVRSIPASSAVYWSALRISYTARTAIGELQVLGCEIDQGIATLEGMMSMRERVADLAVGDDNKEKARRSVAVGHTKLAHALTLAGKGDEAGEHFERSLIIRQELLAKDSASPRFKRDVETVRFLAAESLNWLGKHAEAIALLDKAIPAIEDLIASAPNDARNRRMVILAFLERADAIANTEDPAMASRSVTAAQEHLDTLRSQSPDYSYLPVLTVRTHAAMAEAAIRVKEAELARVNIRAAKLALDGLRENGVLPINLRAQDLHLVLLSGQVDPEADQQGRAKTMLEALDSAGQGCHVNDRLRDRILGGV